MDDEEGKECQDKVLYMSPGRLEWIGRKGAWPTELTGRIFYVRGCCIFFFSPLSLSRKFFWPSVVVACPGKTEGRQRKEGQLRRVFWRFSPDAS